MKAWKSLGNQIVKVIACMMICCTSLVSGCGENSDNVTSQTLNDDSGAQGKNDVAEVRNFTDSKYVLYRKDGLSYYYNLDEDISLEISDGQVNAPKVTGNGQTVVFLDEKGNLCYQIIQEKPEKAVTIDDGVGYYILNQMGDAIFYAKFRKNTLFNDNYFGAVRGQLEITDGSLTDWLCEIDVDLFVYHFDSGKKEPICTGSRGIDGIAISENGDTMFFHCLDREKVEFQLWRWTKDAGTELIASKVSRWYAYHDCQGVCFVSRTELGMFLYVKNGEEEVKCIDGSGSVKDIIAVSDEGEIYFMSDSNEIIWLMPYVLTETEYNYWLDKMSKDDANYIKAMYKKYDINNPRKVDTLTPQMLAEKYPIYETEVIYLLKDDYNYKFKQKCADIFESVGYTFDDYARSASLSNEEITNGCDMLFFYSKGEVQLINAEITDYFVRKRVLAVNESPESAYAYEMAVGSVSDAPIVAFSTCFDDEYITIQNQALPIKSRSKYEGWLWFEDWRKGIFYVDENGAIHCLEVDEAGEYNDKVFAFGVSSTSVLSATDEGVYHLSGGNLYLNEEKIIDGDGGDFSWIGKDINKAYKGKTMICLSKFDEVSDDVTNCNVSYYLADDLTQSLQFENTHENGENNLAKGMVYRNGALCYLKNTSSNKSDLYAWMDGNENLIDQGIEYIYHDDAFWVYHILGYASVMGSMP